MGEQCSLFRGSYARLERMLRAVGAMDSFMNWTLRYASHLGYRSPELPLFRATTGGCRVEDHIALSARLGFSGVQYALAVTRPQEELALVAKALGAANLEAGCILYAPIDVVRSPLWAQPHREVGSAIERRLRKAIEVAQSVNSRYVAVLTGADPRLPAPVQRENFKENLTAMATLAESENILLCLENIAPTSLPNMLLQHIEDAHAVVREVNSPAIRLIFDTAHVQAVDGDVLEHLERCLPDIALVQFADSPGRLEPGTGCIDFRGVIKTLQAHDYRGLVELEHGWSEPTAECEGAAIRRLHEWDCGQ
jgi:hydroxypyruvate isomerase